MKRAARILIVSLSLILIAAAIAYSQGLIGGQILQVTGPAQGPRPAPQSSAAALNPPALQSSSQPSQSAARQAGGPVAVQASVDRQVFKLGEPLIVTVTLINEGSEPVAVQRAIDIRYGLVSLYIASAGGSYQRYLGPDFGTKSAIIGLSSLAPGEQISTTFPVLYHVVSKQPDELPYFYAFDRAGKYQLKVEMSQVAPGQNLVSRPITVDAEPPAGRDAQVWKLLQTEDAAKLLHTGISPAGSSIAWEFEQIITQYPDSTYAPYLRAAVASSGSQGKQPSPAQPSVNVAIKDIAGQAVSVVAQPGMSQSAADAIAQKIVSLANSWITAYNTQDIARWMQSLSTDNAVRQKWEQGPGDRDRKEVENRVRNIYATSGKLSVEIVRLSIGSDTVLADAVGSFQKGEANQPKTMKFVKDGDGEWRIMDGGF